MSYKTATSAALGDHVLFPYSTAAEQQAVLTPYLIEGLRRGEAVRYFAYETPLDRVPAWLREAGVDPGPYESSGQFAVVPTMDVIAPEGRVDPERAFEAARAEAASVTGQGYAGLRVTGENSWAGEGVPGSELAIEFEIGLTREFAGTRFLSLCQYDRRRLSRRQLTALERVHPQVLAVDGAADESRLQVRRLGRGLELAGDVDLSTHDQLAAELSVATREGLTDGVDLIVDLNHLRFADSTGIGLLVRAAEALPRGGSLVLVSPSVTVRTILHVLHWDRSPKIRVVDRWGSL